MSDIPPELVRLFADEAATRLGRLSEQLLQLEERGHDGDLVDSVFRDAHTIKGSAGMMGFRDFAEVAHRMEDLLQGVRSGERQATPAMIDALLAAVDGLRAQLPQVVEGQGDAAALADLELRLRAVAEGGGPASRPAAPPMASSAPPATAAAGAPPAPAPAGDEGFARVPLTRVAQLVRLAGEASAVHARLVGALAEKGAAPPAEAFALGHVLQEIEATADRARMVPLSTVLEPLRRSARDIAKAQDKAVRLDVSGEDTELERHVLDRLADALLHLVRNAVDHGVELPVERVQRGKKAQAVVRVAAVQRGREVVVTVADDGRGVDLARVRAAAGDPALSDDELLEALFRPGLSTAESVTAVSGRGVGLDVVRTALAPLRGRVDLRTEAGKGTTFTLTVPLHAAAAPCLVLRCDGKRYALPLASVAGTRSVEPGDVPLGSVLGVPVIAPRAAVTVSDGAQFRSFSVDELVEERGLVVRGVGALPPVPVVAGAAVYGDGSVVVVLDAAGLIGAIPAAPVEAPPPAPAPSPDHRVLVVDDDAVVREVYCRLLQGAGYEVRDAADGAEGLAVLREWPADLAIVDVEMPVMDGLALTESLRADPVLRGTAVLMLTSLGSERDRRRGMEAGADGYIVKGTYAQDELLEAVARLLGREG